MGSLFSSFSLFADIFPQTLIHGLEIFIRNVKPDHLNFFFLLIALLSISLTINTIHFILFIAEIKKKMYKYCVIYTKDAITFMDRVLLLFLFFTLLCLGYHRVTELIGLLLNHERDNRKINFQKSLGKWFLKCIYIVYNVNQFQACIRDAHSYC